ncbi:hypothetical protein EST38_g195 [Candolleomyces aberdarensis]|uniref:Uncharacterized protein n=1 Tax=Candolleomyces aberdarensis TaxID=2316362 RepID=A0A4Q2DZD6_9AGAR|nr:hypothetical protein EST38_g195 [Candolleomyces aberdarensis]
MAPGHNAEPGAGPVGYQDSLSEKETIDLLRRRLAEAEKNAKLWKEQADEAKIEYTKCKSNARVLQQELENTQKELTRVRNEVPSVIKQDEKFTITTAAEAAKVKKAIEQFDKDYALAKKLDRELNAREREEGLLPGDHTIEDAPRPPSSARSDDGKFRNGYTESQMEKAKAKYDALRKKFEEMEGYVHHYQRALQEERVQHHRTYHEAQALEMECNAARRQIHLQDKELNVVRERWNEMKEMKEELESFLDRWNTHLGSRPCASHSAYK